MVMPKQYTLKGVLPGNYHVMNKAAAIYGALGGVDLQDVTNVFNFFPLPFIFFKDVPVNS